MKTLTLAEALAAKRFETARRIGLDLMAVPACQTPDNVLLLHDAYVALADFRAARELLETHAHLFAEEPFRIGLKLAQDFRLLADEGYYRESSEAKAGYTIDEYVAKYRDLFAKKVAEVERLAETEAQRDELEILLRQGRRKAKKATAPSQNAGTGELRGTVLFPDGTPAAAALMTLGLKTEVEHVDPATFSNAGMTYCPKIGPMQTRTARSDATGAFVFYDLPEGVHDYLAITLDGETWEIPTRFLARSVAVSEGTVTELGTLTIEEWQSAPAVPLATRHPEVHRDGGRKVAEWHLCNPFHYAFRRQLVRFPLPDASLAAASLRVEITSGEAERFQVSQGEIVVLTDLAARTEKSVALYAEGVAQAESAGPLQLMEEGDGVWRIETGAASFCIAGGTGGDGAAPVQSVRGADGVWRGKGRFILPLGVSITGRSSCVLERGPLFLRVLITYTLSNHSRYALELTAIAGEPYLLIKETSDAVEGAAFEFSLREFSGGRAFLHWTPESGARHWSTLERSATEVARLPESVPWWISPQGFGCAMTPDGLRENDYIAIFTLRRGEWIDREFARIANGPIDRNGEENRELDWPFPEMVGSSISGITAHTDTTGDAFFRFGMFDGERMWGLLVSTLEENDGPYKELSAIQHANSSPRLQDFKDWHFDVADRISRPHVVVARDRLKPLRRKTRDPQFSGIWSKIASGRVSGPSEGLAFALDGDPALAWRKRIELLVIAETRSRMTLLGRDFGDHYSPVGGRPITQWAEEYDLLAPSGVFSPEEERVIRAFFILMGHMFMETDFMNWKFNGRNANFEADRVDIVAAIGLVFDGHPDASKFLEHAVERTHKALAVYCTPGSGKWYENPACYYLHAAKCRMNLVFHLANHGRLDVSEIPRLKEFLNWGVLLLTPPQPVSYAIMRDGGEASYLSSERVRKIPPVGDHAGLGRWFPEFYFLMGKLFRHCDPEFGQELMDAYFCSNGDGCRLLASHSGVIEQEGEQPFASTPLGTAFGNLPLLFTTIEPEDIPLDPQVVLASRRLEGFGAVCRRAVNTQEEEYLLIKQGPGGYRYHRTEGSFLLFSKGRPLIYDGGEAGETWRHSTLSFYDVRMPMAAGRVERFFANPQLHFVQGIHPEVIIPGEPVFLSDRCEHQLVEEAYRRFEKPNPAVVRSFLWIGGDYLVVHDALEIDASVPTHWHLQVVGHRGQGTGGEYRFEGRFGIDLQVLLPGQAFVDERIEDVPILECHGDKEEWFAMQHLQLSGKPGVKGYLAVIRPTSKGEGFLSAEPLMRNGRLYGTRVTGDGVSDLLWFDRDGHEYGDGGVTFRGTYGAVIEREHCKVIWLGGAGVVQTAEITLQSDSAPALLEIGEDGAVLHASGTGKIEARVGGRTFEVHSNGEQAWMLR